MYRTLPIAALLLMLSACAPLVEQSRDTGLPGQFGSSSASSTSLQQAEEVNARLQNGQGELAAEEAQEVPERVIIERLLPTGLIEVGNRDAPVTLLLFTEHHCRYCKEFQSEHFLNLYKDYIEPGKLKLQIAILPLQKYLGSEVAASGLLCAAAQSKGIPMHEILFTSVTGDAEAILAKAKTLGLDSELFAACLSDTATKTVLEMQKSLARSLDVTLVPTFFLNGEKSVGLPYYPDLEGMIEEALN